MLGVDKIIHWNIGPLSIMAYALKEKYNTILMYPSWNESKSEWNMTSLVQCYKNISLKKAIKNDNLFVVIFITQALHNSIQTVYVRYTKPVNEM